ncbi:MAG: glycyl-radical enzyme activating protein [Lachnospirales bacterium]
MEGIIFDIQKFSIHDGPGIRTTIFLKGCNMKCLWCHNPESFTPTPQLAYMEEKCIQCKACSVCPHGVHSFNEKHYVDFGKCTMCKECINICPSDALKSYGYTIESSEILKEILKDRKYYDKSGGGVTFSGGEATFQPDFLIELMEKCKMNNIHIALETNGYIREELLLKLLKYVNLYLFDIKETDASNHKKYTGLPIDTVLKNLDLIHESGGNVILRCPIIPNINNRKEHLQNIKKLAEKYNYPYEILNYHDIGVFKWKELGYIYKI